MSDDAAVKELSQPLVDAKFWMKLSGVMAIIYGVLTAITIVGLIVAWLPIWLGILMFQSASAAERAQASGDKQALLHSLRKIKTYFVILGILTLIGLVVMVIGMIFGGMGIMGQLGGMGGMGKV